MIRKHKKSRILEYKNESGAFSLSHILFQKLKVQDNCVSPNTEYAEYCT